MAPGGGRQPPSTSGFPVTLGLPPTLIPGPFGSFCDAPAAPSLQGPCGPRALILVM